MSEHVSLFGICKISWSWWHLSHSVLDYSYLYACFITSTNYKLPKCRQHNSSLHPLEYLSQRLILWCSTCICCITIRMLGRIHYQADLCSRSRELQHNGMNVHISYLCFLDRSTIRNNLKIGLHKPKRVLDHSRNRDFNIGPQRRQLPLKKLSIQCSLDKSHSISGLRYKTQGYHVLILVWVPNLHNMSFYSDKWLDHSQEHLDVPGRLRWRPLEHSFHIESSRFGKMRET